MATTGPILLMLTPGSGKKIMKKKSQGVFPSSVGYRVTMLSLCSILITVEKNFILPSIERVGFGIRIIKCKSHSCHHAENDICVKGYRVIS
jgi:hypothetical protein